MFESHLIVSDLDRSIAFYRDVVGLDVAYVVRDRGVAFLWIGGRGQSMLGVWRRGDAPQHTWLHLAFSAPLADVLDAPRALRAAGVTPLDFDGRPTDAPIVLAWMPAASIYFCDPDGHLLEYLAMLPDAPQPEREIVRWPDWQPSAVRGARVRVLAMSGSLRRGSSNSALLAMVQQQAPDGVEVVAYAELADLPPFNPDLDTDLPPAAIARFHAALTGCDAVVISSPEYAHGVPGVLKNALDWVVGSGELIDKPVAVITLSPRSVHARASLLETLTTMSARVVEAASVTVVPDNDGFAATISTALAALTSAVRR